MQEHLLADPKLEARVAQIVASTAYECPLCYYKERELKSTPGYLWPKRMRWLADVQRKWRGCGRLTFHCSAGSWEPGQKVDLEVLDE